MGRAYDIVKTEQDLTHLSWDEHACPSGLDGTRAKAREGTGPNAVYYKKRHTGELGKHARDCFAELLCSRIMRALGVACVPTQLLRAKVAPDEPAQWIIRSKSYRNLGERAIPLSAFFEMRGRLEETPLDLCLRMGWEREVVGTFLVDYLTATRSRDESCFEVLCGKDGTYRLSPCMPRGYSLANAFPANTWRMFATADVKTDNYLGSTSLEENLVFLPDELVIPPLGSNVRAKLMAGLEDIEPDSEFLEASWRIIQGRWNHLENLRDL